MLKPIGLNDIIATLDAGRGYWPEPRSSFDYAEAYGRGIGNAVANDARQFVTHNFLTNQGAEEQFILMMETVLFLNSSLSNKYEVLSHLAGNLVHNEWPVGTRQVQKIVKLVANRARIAQEVTLHILRYTFATLALQKGISLAAVQKIFGAG